jgi:hypothetical protein
MLNNPSTEQLTRQFSHLRDQSHIVINIAQQSLQLMDAEKVLFSSRIASAKNGLGERFGSECTPRGWHSIRAKIGHDCPINTVFVGRRPTGEIFSEHLREQYPERDWILTRILWLSGLQVGFNRLGKSDTMRRYIYIHGCPDSDPMGIPSSHGCIKMRNTELLQLFSLVNAGTAVLIDA